MTKEEAWNRIDAIITKNEVDDEYVTITNSKDYDALRYARKVLEQEPCDEYGNYKYPSDVELTDPNTATSMPCGDAISRQAALECCRNEWEEEVEIRLKSLPPVTPQQNCEDIAKAFQFGMALGFGEKHDEMDKVVEEIKKVVTPQPKTEHWIEHPHEAGANWEFSRYECSECHEWADDDSDYCPDCGCRMVEPQESEG